MSQSFDIAIVGFGAMGSAVACQLARRRKKVVAFDSYSPPHSMGSTHGESRVIREAYFEHPLYVPLAQRSYEIWHALEAQVGEHLLIQTGGILLGPPDGVLISGTRLSADRHGLNYEMLNAREVHKRYPVLRPGSDTVGLFERRAGVLLPEQCVKAHMQVAADAGAEFHFDTAVESWISDGDGVELKTANGTFRAGQLVLSPGAWLDGLLPELSLPLTIERQVLHWVQPAKGPERFGADELVFFAWEYREGALFYVIPDLGSGVKIALHHQGEITDLDRIERDVADEEVEEMEKLIAAFVPEMRGTMARSHVCMYTNTPDEHFLIDRHPMYNQVLIVSPCSGHGFKFASVVGEIVADLAIEGKSQFDLSPFAIDRLIESKEGE